MTGSQVRLGLVHPGSMGVTVGRAVAERAEVLWAGAGRSATTTSRARDAAFTDVGTLDELVCACDVIVSVVPPAAAEQTASDVAELGFDGVYADANAISPERARRVAGLLSPARFVDGGIVGPPAVTEGSTRLYLSGSDADIVARLFEGSVLEPIVLDDEVGTASALKMAYAAYTKGSTALVMGVRALAERHGITPALLAEWERSIPELPDRSDAMLGRSPVKAWRFSGEMDEIADTFAAAGLPAGFHVAAAEVFGRVGPEAGETDPSDIVLRLLAPGAFT